jgi:hypothetical protein
MIVRQEQVNPINFKGLVIRDFTAGSHGVYAVATDSTGATKTCDANFIFVDPAPTTVAISGQITDGDGTGMAGLRITLSGSKTATVVTNM